MLATLACLLALALAPCAVAATADAPITPGPSTTLPDYLGRPAWPLPVLFPWVPQDPHLAPNPGGTAHNDSWNSDTAAVMAALGRRPVVWSSNLASTGRTLSSLMTSTMGFDSKGRLVAACVSGEETFVVLIDPVSLAVLSSYELTGSGLGSLGSAYFFVDERDQIVIANGADKIITLREGGTEVSPVLELVSDETYDLSALSPLPVPAGDHLAGLCPDWQGRIWFSTAGSSSSAPRVGVIDPATYPTVKWVELGAGEHISNGFAVGRTSAYVVTSQKMYRVWAQLNNQPAVAWSEPYDTTGVVKPGQYSLGSGTSPTIMGSGKYVAIADNAVPMKVVVFRTAAHLHGHEERIVGETPVFAGMQGQAAENSLIGLGSSLIVENNYGWYRDPATLKLTPSLPGYARVDVRANGRGLRTVWVNEDVASTVSMRLSTRNGLIYTVARKIDANGLDVYYWTALSFRTGKVVWEKMAGTGILFDSYYPGLAISPRGVLYLGVGGGLIALKDGSWWH
jgi:hypothetical protein